MGKPQAKKKETILVLCAHSDDQIFGAGGSIAKWAKEGKDIIIIVFSFGEKSHPWLQKRYTIEMRVKESHEASRIVGAKKTMFLGVEEGKFAEEIESKKIGQKMVAIIKEYRPSMIITHAQDDPHSDHRAVAAFVIGLAEHDAPKVPVYAFEIWNVVNISKRDVPKLYIDITDTFKTKLAALKCFRSQKVAMLSLLWSVYWRAIRCGKQAGCKFAEVFYKVR